MADSRYSALPEQYQSNEPSSPKHQDKDSISDESDIVYRDNLEIEPFDEKDTRFQDEPNMEDGEEGYIVQPSRLRPRKKSRKILAVLVAILLSAGTIGILAGWGYSAPSYSVKGGNRHITLDHVLNGTFSPKTVNIDWVKEAPDGTYSLVDEDRNILLKNVHNTSSHTVLVDSSMVLDQAGNTLHWRDWSLSADMEYVLFQADYVKQWRHSSHANYYVHRLSDQVTFPIAPPSDPPVISRCNWSPIGHSLAFVSKNDIYVIPGDQMAGSDPIGIRITDDGSDVVFNGVPDWVYEEEVISGDSTIWWSPDGQTLAYLRMDEDEVREFRLQYYNPSNDAFEPHQYPTELDMRYPNPGTPNPIVSVHTFSLSSYLSSHLIESAKNNLIWPNQLDPTNQVISEVAWVSADELLVREIDRSSKTGNVVLFSGGAAEGKVVRKLGREGEQGDEGWIDQVLNVHSIEGWETPGYLDIVPQKGYDHIAFFSPPDSPDPIWLTSGDWEVTNIAGIDVEKGLVYFIAANPSIDRHVFSVPLPTSSSLQDYTQNVTALTDTSVPGYHDVSFSPGAGYYLLAYQGPNVPHMRLIETEHGGVDVMLEENKALNATLSEYMRPVISQSTFTSDGYELNMMEIHPPNLDVSGRKKYPVLLQVYGGPGSQQVSNKFKRDWHTYLACEKKYIIVTVDGRGTGFKGRQLRNPVRDDLGHWEAVDFIKAIGEVSKRSYVDTKRIGMWGWSYGGYITLKTMEAQKGAFTLGMAVAPVTDFLLYDSIYTERYMSTPTTNPQGYVMSAVNNVSAFGEIDFAWAHGSGDDNVHYANTAALLDKLTQRQVRGWRFRMFTDSDHSMNKRGAFRELYEWMTAFLDEKWGRGGKVRNT